MYNKLIFFNEFGHGDIFESREFVKELMNIIPAKEYFYAHGKNPRILLDVPELKFMEFDKNLFHSMKSVYKIPDDILLWNTWIGRDGKYVLPGYGCSVEKLHKMHNDMLRMCGFEQLSKEPIEYIPQIDYLKYDIDGVINFVETYRYEKDLILIDNGLVQSNQASNFLFDNVIYQLASEMKDKIFIVTHKIAHQADNIFFTDDITGRPGGFDLNEISFLSTFCRVIIGRSSGAYTFSQVKQNVHDQNKKLLAFTYHKLGSSFVVNTPVEIQKYWSSATSEDSVYTNMKEVIKNG